MGYKSKDSPDSRDVPDEICQVFKKAAQSQFDLYDLLRHVAISVFDSNDEVERAMVEGQENPRFSYLLREGILAKSEIDTVLTWVFDGNVQYSQDSGLVFRKSSWGLSDFAFDRLAKLGTMGTDVPDADAPALATARSDFSGEILIVVAANEAPEKESESL
ncbi:MAG: hypothetical protein UT55_C0026G0008 [Candidatus Peregrinibacteria bacterium GW2011_GWE2_39_6]|nr:MAG: hypothetical protein UT36_C0001G0080 [Candidatus Peregrinibacteria bacterium GW2011_GWF2_39_17]KKR25878.1 MAG: hypothetical protein UT55_C0026G0008 [Candidatus Peregrinibacteria bacterium GW2011_GWE2_39_6]HCW32421.1 hypothetical protein [Candidatus Peregrinibacteria bacterium]